MCWIGERNSTKVATEDIKVFKLVFKIGNNEYSPYYYDDNFRYHIGKEAKAEIRGTLFVDALGHRCTRITEGLHSYSLNDCSVKLIRTIGVRYKFIDFAVFDKNNSIIVNYVDVSTLEGISSLSIVEMVIPMGSTYYENEHGEMVSDRLIPVKDITETIVNKPLEVCTDIKL